MSRLFTFGCSFTNFFWPTWADIAGRSFDEHQNWGLSGSGNQLIFYSLNEAIVRNNIGYNDTVVIMWTGIGREDRWKNGWLTGGSVYLSKYYDEKYIRKYADTTGYLLRDLSTMAGTELILKQLGCKYKFFSTQPFPYQDDTDIDKKSFLPNEDVNSLYSDIISKIQVSFFEAIYGFDYYKKDIERVPNYGHPSPNLHMQYLNIVWPELIISDDTKNWIREINDLLLSGLDPRNLPYNLWSVQNSNKVVRFR